VRLLVSLAQRTLRFWRQNTKAKKKSVNDRKKKMKKKNEKKEEEKTLSLSLSLSLHFLAQNGAVISSSLPLFFLVFNPTNTQNA
jgi:hypothetical protein